MIYPRSLTKESKPFDPIEVSKETEKIVIDGDKRKYNLFRLERFYGQIATARGVGCNLRCGFCWINPSRDYPEKYGIFYSPQEVYNKLIEISSNEFGRAIMSGVARISGCEPTIGINHLLPLIKICKKTGDFKGFLLETNGILLGYNEDFAKELSEFNDYLLVRLSFKAGTPEDFERKTGAEAKYFDLQFRTLEFLKKHKISYRLAAMSKDPKIMPPKERLGLLERMMYYGVENIDLLEEENADPFGITKRRLIKRGIVNNVEEIRKEVYEPLKTSIVRALKILKGKNKGYEVLAKLGKGELKRFFDIIEFKKVESPCATCTKENPWHGHGIEDDLDSELD